MSAIPPMPTSPVDYRTPIQNMLRGLNLVKDDESRRYLRTELKAELERIINDYPDRYEPDTA